jgi:hypothetical protein
MNGPSALSASGHSCPGKRGYWESSRTRLPAASTPQRDASAPAVANVTTPSETERSGSVVTNGVTSHSGAIALLIDIHDTAWGKIHQTVVAFD